MKTLFLESRKKFNEIDLSLLDNLPGKTISLAATIQYLSLLPKVQSYLREKGKKVIIGKGPVYEGQVLGCNPSAFSKQADTLLLITDGKFHALNNAVNLDREIYVFSGMHLDKLSQEEINKVKARRTAAIKKFLSSDKIGLLVSTKPGQNYSAYKTLKSKIEKKGKKVFVFEADNINPQEFENFPINIYVNTACYGLGLDDSRIVNVQDILEFI